jgi:Ribbon-helix-helix protein, copG family
MLDIYISPVACCLQKGEREMVTTMKKTLIYMDEDVRRRLRYLALDENVSMAELIRQAIDKFLKEKKGGRRHGKTK